MEQDNKFNEEIQKKAKRLAVAYGKVFESEEGRLILHDLMRVTGFQQSPFSEDPYKTAFEAGRQSIVHEIIRAMNVDLTKYLEIVVDSNKAQEEDFNV